MWRALTTPPCGWMWAMWAHVGASSWSGATAVVDVDRDLRSPGSSGELLGGWIRIWCVGVGQGEVGRLGGRGAGRGRISYRLGSQRNSKRKMACRPLCLPTVGMCIVSDTGRINISIRVYIQQSREGGKDRTLIVS